MRVIVAGTRSFGAAALKATIGAGHEVLFVVSLPGDRLANEAIYDHRLPFRTRLDHQEIYDARADLIIGAHTHVYIGAKSRAAARRGALIGHPSLLPRHRGRDSVEWTIRMHDPITGFSWFFADRGVDTGPIAAQDWCFVDPTWDASDLWRERLFPLGIGMLPGVLGEIERGAERRVPQDRRFATTEPSLDPTYLHRAELLELSDRPYAGEPQVTR